MDTVTGVCAVRPAAASGHSDVDGVSETLESLDRERGEEGGEGNTVSAGDDKKGVATGSGVEETEGYQKVEFSALYYHSATGYYYDAVSFSFTNRSRKLLRKCFKKLLRFLILAVQGMPIVKCVYSIFRTNSINCEIDVHIFYYRQPSSSLLLYQQTISQPDSPIHQPDRPRPRLRQQPLVAMAAGTEKNKPRTRAVRLGRHPNSPARWPIFWPPCLNTPVRSVDCLTMKPPDCTMTTDMPCTMIR